MMYYWNSVIFYKACAAPLNAVLQFNSEFFGFLAKKAVGYA